MWPRRIADLDGVQLAEDLAGPYDVIARVEASGLDELGRLIVFRIQVLDGVTRTVTCMVLHRWPHPNPEGRPWALGSTGTPRGSSGYAPSAITPAPGVHRPRWTVLPKETSTLDPRAAGAIGSGRLRVLS